MPFFQIDDHLHSNRKVRALAGRMLAGDRDGLAALGVWTLAGSMSQDVGTDGVVSLQMLISVGYDAVALAELARLLVDAGLWHAVGHECTRCEAVPTADPTSGLPMACWRFHDWSALRYDTAEQVRENRAKRGELQNPSVVNAVWSRDCVDPDDALLRHQADCRYCGTRVKRHDRSSKDESVRATLDHVDPAQARGVRNLVIACFGCNRRKGRRTPAEAGMTLRPAPRVLTEAQEAAEDAAVSPGTTPAAGTPSTPSAPVSAPREPREGAPGARPADRPGGASNTPSNSSSNCSSNPPEVSSGGRAGARTGVRPGQGQGQGQGEGLGEGEGSGSVPGSPASPGRGRRRRRGRGGRKTNPPTTQQPAPAPQPDAGDHPLVHGPGRDGSPWFGYHGPPNPLGDETHCPRHHLPEPCRRCDAEYQTQGDAR
ncbi:HNH endonuclease [Cellulomonas iranensis]|uniref:HNH endonuclease n=1 Tax=Cellulomonas iranensis TaxID=76862 RepID=UPI000B3C773A|nr:HNH endonuclease [Cellulomonas iranensis]